MPFFQYHHILKAFLFHIYCIEKSHVYFISAEIQDMWKVYKKYACGSEIIILQESI